MRPLAAGLMLLGLVACAPLAPGMPAGEPPTPRVAAPSGSAPPMTRPAQAPSDASRALAARYGQVERDLRARGLLRTDGGGPDAPFDAETLTRNFVRIALFDEFVPVSGRLVARETSSRLRRWSDPVRVTPVFGRSVTPAQRAADRATLDALTARLAIASGHDIAVTDAGGNMTVYVVNEDERRALGPRLRAELPGIGPEVLDTVRDMPPSTYCLMIAFSADSAPYAYVRAVGVVRAEHPPLLRRSCFHEEIAQGLGLANDSPEARPSIFNDDEEYALLTAQDELLLAILYDPRLSPGMTALDALPAVREIAKELIPPEPRATLVPLRNDPGET